MTVLFADLVGFTTLAETRDPEQVKNLVDRCFEELVAVISAYGGRVDKIIGDAIVALFGAPVAHEDDAERAVRAGLAMQQALDEWAGQEAATHLRLRVGVNTGEVLVGAMRAGGDYTAMGDTVNTASRLQTMGAPGQVVVGPATFQATRRVVRYTPLGALKAKGREEPVEAWLAEEGIGLPGARSAHDGPLIGREAELDVLRGAVSAAVSRGRSQLVLVMAEAGMGKTRLASEIACEAATTHDATVLEGRCVPYGEANVWWPVAEAVRTGCGIVPGAPRSDAAALAGAVVREALGGADEVEQVTDGLLHLMGYETALRGIDPARAREDLVRSLLAFVDGATSRRPVIVVLSDLHWADDVVLELGDALLERVATKPFVLIATARPTLFDRWQPRPGRHNLVVLNLDPLTREAAGALLDTLVDGTTLASDLREVLIDRSGGNPFFLEELVSLVTDTHQSGELPHTLRGLVAARLDALPLVERRMLEDAAVLGRRGTVEALHIMAAKAHGVDDDELIHGAVDGLVTKDVLVVDAGVWSFKSDLVREVAYGMLTKADRARRHAGVAYWLSAHEPDRPESVDRMAHHFATAAGLVRDLGRVDHLDGPELLERALAALVLAVERAEAGELHVVARKLCTQAIGLLADDDPARVRFLLARARAATQLRDMAAARDDLATAMAEADRAADQEAVARALLCLGDVEQKEGELVTSGRHLEEAIATFRALGDACGEADALRTYGMTRMFGDDHSGAASAFSEALDLYRTAGDRRGEAWVLQNLAWLAFSFGDVETAEQLDPRLDGDVPRDRRPRRARLRLRAAGLRALPAGPLRRGRGARRADGRRCPRARRWMGDGDDARAGGVDPPVDRPGGAGGRTRPRGLQALHRDARLVRLEPGGRRARALAAGQRPGRRRVRGAARCGDRGPHQRLSGRPPSRRSVSHQPGERGGAGGGARPGAGGGGRARRRRVRLGGAACVAVARGRSAGRRRRRRHGVGGGHEPKCRPARTGLRRSPWCAPRRATWMAPSPPPPGPSSYRAPTYSDRAHALVARALAHAAAGDRDQATAAVDEAVALVDATEDVVLRAVVGSARARVAERFGDADAAALHTRAEADLTALGITQRGWDGLYRKALAASLTP